MGICQKLLKKLHIVLSSLFLKVSKASEEVSLLMNKYEKT